MRIALLLAGVLTVGSVLVFSATDPVAQAAGGTCLRIRDLGNLTPIDDTTLRATSRNRGDFIVKMRGPCRDFRELGNYYTLNVLSDSECFDGDDVLRFRNGGVCFVESVTPVPR